MLEQQYIDDDGQPIILAWNLQRRVDAGIDELLGLLRGILADGIVTQQEVHCLAAWVLRHPDVVNDWPVNVLVRRLNRIYADGKVDPDEQTDLQGLLSEIVGENEHPLDNPVSKLPLCKPAPEVIFDRNIFVFTGKFAYGPRRICQTEVIQRGGICSENVTLQTSYVVIGSVGSRDWIHSSWGRKIETAVDLKRRCDCSIGIISERRWAEFLLAAK